MVIPCLCLRYGHGMLGDTSTKWKHYDLWPTRISIDGGETLEAIFLGRESVALDV